MNPGDSLTDALRRASDGDTVEIASGDHRGQVGTVTQRRLVLRGVGATRPVLHADGRHAEGKAILVVRDGDVRIENLEFRGARVPDANGAGIRFERGRLHVQGCAFIDNQNGILTANFADAELHVEDSEFDAAPHNTSLPHLIYVGRIARFTLQGSRVAGGQRGHLVKSRARVSRVLYNQLVDGAGGNAAYELEFPNGGDALVLGNTIGQGPGGSNPTLLSYGAEGEAPPSTEPTREHRLRVAHNTFVNTGLKPAIFLWANRKLAGGVQLQAINNLSIGLGVGELALADATEGNYTLPRAALVDADTGVYALPPGSWLRGRGVLPPADLVPTAEFTPPLGTRPIAAAIRPAPGAFP